MNQSCFVLGALGLLGALPAQTTFLTTNHVVGTSPDQTVLGDVDRDGDLDFVVAIGSPTNGVAVWRNNGAGAFTFWQTVPIASQSRTVALEDLDGDGDLDLAVGTGTGQVVVRPNLGTGSFGAGTAFAVGANPRGLTVADLNRDGRLDLAVANRDADTMSILMNTGGLSFSVTTLPTGQEPRNVVAADVNRDSLPDLVVANHDSRNVSVRLNLGAGAFGAQTLLSVGSSFRAEWVTTGDVDGDGDVDLIVALGETNGRVGVFPNVGNGTFGAQQVFLASAVEPATVMAMDMNGDRTPDLVTSNEDSGNASVLLNNGFGSFVPSSVVPTGLHADGLAGGDLDGDGDMDFVVPNRDSNTVTVVTNTTPGAATNATMRLGALPVNGTVVPIELDSPQHASMLYIAALSFAATPQLPLGDGRFLPVAFSDLLSFTLGPSAIWPDPIAFLDGSGHATARFAIPSAPGLVGLPLFGVCLVLDSGKSLGIGAIADQFGFVVQ